MSNNITTQQWPVEMSINLGMDNVTMVIEFYNLPYKPPYMGMTRQVMTKEDDGYVSRLIEVYEADKEQWRVYEPSQIDQLIVQLIESNPALVDEPVLYYSMMHVDPKVEDVNQELLVGA